MNKRITLIITLSFLLLILLFATLLFGSVRLNFGNLNESEKYILYKLRLPRFINALCTGGILALSGLIFQCVFKNIMADSYVLGVSSAASAFAVLTLLIPFTRIFFSTSFFSIIGSVVSVSLLILLTKGNTEKLLLSGITLNFFFSALSSILLYLSEDGINKIFFWTMGSFSASTPLQSIVIFILFLLLFFITQINAKKMNILLLDDETALSSGISIKNTKTFLLLAASICTAVCVSFFGVIGFVGLMSANIIRRVTGSDHRALTLPAMLFGGVITVFSDFISHMIVRPSEIPVGLVTAISGSIAFVTIIRKRKTNYE